MAVKNKYKAKPVYYDLVHNNVVSHLEIESYRIKGKLNTPPWIHRFDSQHEFKVYLKLVDMYEPEAVQLQIPILLFPKSFCHPNGKYWKVDFMVTNPKNLLEVLFYVEAKGIITKEFEFILSVLEHHDPDTFTNLHLVFPNKLPTNNRLLKSIQKTDFSQRIYTRPQFNRLQQIL